ncbi:MAG: glycosyltransferase [Algoriphagus sp.]|uniref:glycosyltransferase n=1 Tax=Algoriphagus sp. TaxID=1872435 RepID=UPI00181E348D|nr:glycosyltransferase [Algoriphagus sp.]NVJ86749.1 glycosyltransferase [Algoriphagus sp.]
MIETPDVSVIIPTFREWDILPKCLQALQNQAFPQEKLEVLIINNDPTSVVPNSLKLPNNMTLFDQPKPGSYASRNLGIDRAKGKILAFTDSDCIPDSNWLANGVKYFEKGADLVGGRVTFFKEADGEELAFLYERQFSFNQKRNIEVNNQSITANLFVKKEVFDKVGSFPEGLLSGGDFEWTKKASKSGFKLVYGEDVIISHPARKSTASLKKKKKRTSGGMYIKFFRDFSFLKKVSYALFLLRPPVTIFFIRKYSIIQRVRLFFLRWQLEWIGVQELFKLSFTGKSAERV